MGCLCRGGGGAIRKSSGCAGASWPGTAGREVTGGGRPAEAWGGTAGWQLRCPAATRLPLAGGQQGAAARAGGVRAVHPHRVRGVDRHAGLRLQPGRSHHRRAGGGGAAGAGRGRGPGGGVPGRPALTGGFARRGLSGAGRGDGSHRRGGHRGRAPGGLRGRRGRCHRGDHDPPGAVDAPPVGCRDPRSADGGQRGRGLAGSRRGRGGGVAGRGADLAGWRGERVRGVRRPRPGGRVAGRRAAGGGAGAAPEQRAPAGAGGGRRGPAAGGLPAAAAAHAGAC